MNFLAYLRFFCWFIAVLCQIFTNILPLIIGNIPIILNICKYIYNFMDEKKENELIKKIGLERNKRYRKYFERRHKRNIKKEGGEL